MQFFKLKFEETRIFLVLDWCCWWIYVLKVQPQILCEILRAPWSKHILTFQSQGCVKEADPQHLYQHIRIQKQLQ